MPRHVALLRAINVGGHIVKMADLRGHFESLGFGNVETFIASGNVIFDARSANAETLQRKIERHLHDSLGYEVATILRSREEIERVAKYRPFTEPLGREAKKVIMGLQTDVDDFHVDGREMYWLCRVASLESTFSAQRLEKTLKVPATFRAMSSVVKLAAKHCSE